MNKDLALKRYLKKEIKTILLNEGMLDKLAKRAKGALSNLAIAGALSFPAVAMVGDLMNQDAAARTRAQAQAQSQAREGDEDNSTTRRFELNSSRIEQIGDIDQLALRLGRIDNKDEFIRKISEIKNLLNSRILNINDIKTEGNVLQYFKMVANRVNDDITNNELFKNSDVVGKHADIISVLNSLRNVIDTN